MVIAHIAPATVLDHRRSSILREQQQHQRAFSFLETARALFRRALRTSSSAMLLTNGSLAHERTDYTLSMNGATAEDEERERTAAASTQDEDDEEHGGLLISVSRSERVFAIERQYEPLYAVILFATRTLMCCWSVMGPIVLHALSSEP